MARKVGLKLRADNLSLSHVALAALTNRRQQLIEMLLAEQNRLDMFEDETKPGIRKHIRFLERQIDDTESEIQRQIKQCPAWNQTDALLERMGSLLRFCSCFARDFVEKSRTHLMLGGSAIGADSCLLFGFI